MAFWVIVYPDQLQLRRPSLHGDIGVSAAAVLDEPRIGYAPAPLQQWYQGLKAAQQLYYCRQWAEDVQQQGDAPSPEQALSWSPRPVAVSAIRAFPYYQWNQDWATENLDVSLSWAPRPLSQLYRPDPWLFTWGEDVSASAAVVQPDTFQGWTPRPLQQPYRPAPPLVEWAPALDVQQQGDAPEPERALSWSPRPLPQLWVLGRGYYWQQWAEDVQQQGTAPEGERALSWVPRPVSVPPLRAFPYYQWNQDWATENLDVSLSWTPRPVGVPYRPSWLFTWRADWVTENLDVSLSWAPRPITQSWTLGRLYYFGQTEHDTNAPAAITDDPQSWIPVPLRINRVPLWATLYYFAQTERASSAPVTAAAAVGRVSDAGYNIVTRPTVTV